MLRKKKLYFMDAAGNARFNSLKKLYYFKLKGDYYYV